MEQKKKGIYQRKFKFILNHNPHIDIAWRSIRLWACVMGMAGGGANLGWKPKRGRMSGLTFIYLIISMASVNNKLIS